MTHNIQRRNFNLLALAGAVASSLGSVSAWAQAAWPSRPIRMIIPSTPGGGTDFTGRQISMKLTEMNGWQVVPDNRPGAGTALGLAEAARAKPDGYELVIAQSDNVSLIPLLMKVTYDPLKDLTPIALAAITPLIIIGKLEQYDFAGATAVAVVMLVISFAMLLVINALQTWQRRSAGAVT